MNQAKASANTQRLLASHANPLATHDMAWATIFNNGTNNGPSFLPRLYMALANFPVACEP